MDPAPYAGRYQLQETLGQGATGRVYRARDLKMDRQVAIKVIQPGKVSNHTLSRLGREARIAAQLQHDHVARVFDFGAHQGTWFIAQELVEGESLEARVHRRGRLRIPESIAHAVNLAQGLQAIHEIGFMHRDLKPDNVIVTAEGEAKLVDFGVAREVDSKEDMRLTRDGSWVGSPLYVAPEAVVGEATPASDVFGLGAIIYCMLTGGPPHEHASGSVVELVAARLDGAESARALRDEVPAQLDELVMRLTAPRAEDRPTLVEALRTLVELKAAGPGSPRAIDRRLVLVGSIVTVLSLLLVVLALGATVQEAETASARGGEGARLAAEDPQRAAAVDPQPVDTSLDEGAVTPPPRGRRSPTDASSAADTPETPSGPGWAEEVGEGSSGSVTGLPSDVFTSSPVGPSIQPVPAAPEGSRPEPPLPQPVTPVAKPQPVANPAAKRPEPTASEASQPAAAEPESPRLGMKDVFNCRASVTADEVELRYTFRRPEEAHDFEVALPSKPGDRARVVQAYLDSLRVSTPSSFRGVEVWTAHRDQLFVSAWSRRRLVAPFRADASLTVELEAQGNRNIAVALVNKGRTYLVVLGYEMPVLPVAVADASLATTWRTEIAKLGQIARKRGPSLAVVEEQGAFLHREVFVQPLRPKKRRNTLAFTLEPGEKSGTLFILVGRRRRIPVEVPIFEGRVDLWLVALGRPVGVDELYVAGRLDGSFRDRAKTAVAEAKAISDLLAWRARDLAGRRKAAEDALKPKAPLDPAVGR